jgi:hypothetical protein
MDDLDELLDEINAKKPHSATPIKELSALPNKDVDNDAHMIENEWDEAVLPEKPKTK